MTSKLSYMHIVRLVPRLVQWRLDLFAWPQRALAARTHRCSSFAAVQVPGLLPSRASDLCERRLRAATVEAGSSQACCRLLSHALPPEAGPLLPPAFRRQGGDRPDAPEARVLDVRGSSGRDLPCAALPLLRTSASDLGPICELSILLRLAFPGISMQSRFVCTDRALKPSWGSGLPRAGRRLEVWHGHDSLRNRSGPEMATEAPPCRVTPRRNPASLQEASLNPETSNYRAHVNQDWDCRGRALELAALQPKPTYPLTALFDVSRTTSPAVMCPVVLCLCGI